MDRHERRFSAAWQGGWRAGRQGWTGSGHVMRLVRRRRHAAVVRTDTEAMLSHMPHRA
jgi:hypothetical protein